jgi:hypothetical protein
VILVELPVRWTLVVDRDGAPRLWHPGWGPRALACVAEQPRTVRRLIERLGTWIETAERHFPVDDQALLAARFARIQLEGFAAAHEGAS